MFMGVSLRVTGWGIGWIEKDLFYIDDSVTFRVWVWALEDQTSIFNQWTPATSDRSPVITDPPPISRDRVTLRTDSAEGRSHRQLRGPKKLHLSLAGLDLGRCGPIPLLRSQEVALPRTVHATADWRQKFALVLRRHNLAVQTKICVISWLCRNVAKCPLNDLYGVCTIY